MQIYYRLKIPITIFWKGFIPIDPSQWIKITSNVNDREVEITIGVLNLEEDFGNTSINDDYLNQGFPSDSIYIFVKDTCESGFQKSLDESVLKCKELPVHIELKEVFRSVYGYFIDICRNNFGQYWIDSDIFVDGNLYSHIEYSIDEKKWFEAFPARISVNSRLFTNGITKEKWEILRRKIKNKESSLFPFQAISNSLDHIDKNHHRMAIVEMCIALESVLKIVTQKIALQDSKFNITKNELDKVIKSLGMALTTKILLKQVRNDIDIKEEEIAICIEMIDYRNNIVHNKAMKIHKERIKKLVYGVKRVIVKLIFQYT